MNATTPPPVDATRKIIAWAENNGVIPQNSLADILNDVREFLCRYIAFVNEAQATAISLWIVFTWAIASFDFSPYLSISSPVKRCGKSRLLDCLRILCRSAWQVIGPSEAVLFRKIEADMPTLLLDEVDAIFTGGKADENKESLRALLNAGFERGTTVPRCVGPTHAIVNFDVFCPKALAGIGRLPDTVADRSIPIQLARRARNQNVEKFRKRDAEAIALPIAERMRLWSECKTVINDLRVARPSIPSELGDRAADIVEPLLAIADLAGAAWPDMARRALVELCTGGEDDSTGVKLLNAIREIFIEKDAGRLTTKDLLDALISRENGEPWPDWWGEKIANGNMRGAASRLAKILKDFDIVGGTIREADGSTAKGYKREAFQDSFSRYLPENSP